MCRMRTQQSCQASLVVELRNLGGADRYFVPTGPTWNCVLCKDSTREGGLYRVVSSITGW